MQKIQRDSSLYMDMHHWENKCALRLSMPHSVSYIQILKILGLVILGYSSINIWSIVIIDNFTYKGPVITSDTEKVLCDIIKIFLNPKFFLGVSLSSLLFRCIFKTSHINLSVSAFKFPGVGFSKLPRVGFFHYPELVFKLPVVGF